MKISAIIAEYNPFHNGHKYQIDTVRALHGSDTAIVAIMSGNFTQRGELAIADKTVRAEAAVRSGVNLVLELPFPYSMASAEFFASAGVHIANSLGVVDFLAFGSELGDTNCLAKIAQRLSSEQFNQDFREISERPEYRRCGYPELCEIAYNNCFPGSMSTELFEPNNILALEYIKALAKENSAIAPLTIKREGAGYNDAFDEDENLQSASAIRKLMLKGDRSAFDYMPEGAKIAFEKAFLVGEAPTHTSLLDTAVISHFRLNSSVTDPDIQDATGGLYNRLCDLSAEATSISALIAAAATKKYTTARIRRALWYSYFGVTSSDVRTPPRYTQVLAMDTVGCSVLKEIKRVSDFPVITKPASYRDCSPEVVYQKELALRAESVFCLARKKPLHGSFPIKFSPFVKKA